MSEVIQPPPGLEVIKEPAYPHEVDSASSAEVPAALLDVVAVASSIEEPAEPPEVDGKLLIEESDSLQEVVPVAEMPAEEGQPPFQPVRRRGRRGPKAQATQTAAEALQAAPPDAVELVRQASQLARATCQWAHLHGGKPASLRQPFEAKLAALEARVDARPDIWDWTVEACMQLDAAKSFLKS